jgi:predicted membrane protein
MNQQLNWSSLRTLCFSTALALPACVVDDADRESAAIQSFENVPYGLTVRADGIELCSNADFGDITNYDRFP